MLIPLIFYLNEIANILFDEMGDAKITGESLRTCSTVRTFILYVLYIILNAHDVERSRFFFFETLIICERFSISEGCEDEEKFHNLKSYLPSHVYLSNLSVKYLILCAHIKSVNSSVQSYEK